MLAELLEIEGMLQDEHLKDEVRQALNGAAQALYWVLDHDSQSASQTFYRNGARTAVAGSAIIH